MTIPATAIVVLCTVPDRETATRLAEAAVTQRLAACVTMLPGAESVYLWEGALERTQELLLVAKTTTAAYAALEQLWLSEHPYELPELIAVPIASGLEAYLQWISHAVSPC
ncbi:MAG: divalent-cation tolerance protein CutA [Gammaproteobacteria bacterium]|nr:divalent-cation tolerance protein CutA [Gammaproteobacteria bacterium]